MENSKTKKTKKIINKKVFKNNYHQHSQPSVGLASLICLLSTTFNIKTSSWRSTPITSCTTRLKKIRLSILQKNIQLWVHILWFICNSIAFFKITFPVFIFLCQLIWVNFLRVYIRYRINFLNNSQIFLSIY